MKKIIDLTPLEISKWYAVAVGEIGIPPTEFYKMTEEEIKWAYEGYKQRQQDTANMILLAINRSKTDHKNDLFEFVESRGYEIGSPEERRNTFIALGIKEE